MAYFPCDAGPHFNPTRNYLIYVGLVKGVASDRWKLRFCRAHFAAIQDDLAEYEVSPEDATVSPLSRPANCLADGKPIEEAWWNLFITAYPPDNERKDYWAGVHADCKVPDLLAKPQNV